MQIEEAIEYLKNYKYDNEVREAIDTLINYVETMHSELDRLEGIEDNTAMLEEKLKIATAMLTKGTYPSENDENNFEKQFIPISVIQNKIDEIKLRLNDDCVALHEFQRIAKIDVLQELLEERNK